MPTYTYRCPKCEATILEARAMGDADNTPTCALCNTPTKRVFDIGAVTFKGKGWGKDR